MRLTNDGRAIESPICLTKDHNGPCNHKWCMMVYEKPHLYGYGIEDFLNSVDFFEFDIRHSLYGGHSFLIPHKPIGAASDFEAFRQSLNAIVLLGGEWPKGLEFVPRDQVEIRWLEFQDSYPVNNVVTLTTEWLPCIDVQQFAFYIGPIEVNQKGAGNE